MSADSHGTFGVTKLPTGIPGFDQVAHDGLPRGRTTLVSGTSGSGKTIFAAQFLAAGIQQMDEAGVFVTFEESLEDIRRNMICFGWDIRAWEEAKRWAFVDGSWTPNPETIEAGDYDLGALLSRIEHAIRRINARRVVLDSMSAIFSQFADHSVVRREMFRISSMLKDLGVTSVMTTERIENYGQIGRHGVEEFVADNVIILRNTIEDEKRRRTLEVLKFRGTPHQLGQWPFTIIPNEGMQVIPLSAIELKQKSSDLRISSGIGELDRMCGGGFFRDSILLVSGATGTGKTLTATHFIKGGADAGEKSLLFAFEESRQQLFRNAKGWGIDYETMEKQGLLLVECAYPEIASLEDHLIKIKQQLDRFRPHRVVIDSCSALERVGTLRGFREFVIGLTSFIKQREVAGMFTATTPTLMGGESVTESHFSTITDSIILLRYVEMFGQMRRGITILKMRGSAHDKDIRAFDIDATGMHIGEAFKNVTGILSGKPQHIPPGEMERYREIYRDLT